MAYASSNPRTKKALREQVAAGERITVFSPGPFGVAQNGTVTLEGPHYPAPHTWYASVTVADGVIVKVHK